MKEKVSYLKRISSTQNMTCYCLHLGRKISERNLLIFRLAMFIFHLAIFCVILAYESDKAKMWLFLTIWGFSLSTFYFFLSTIETIFLKGHSQFLWKLCVVLLEITISLEFLITLFYWVVLFYYDYERVTSSGLFFFLNLSVHGICYLALCLDLHLNCLVFDRSHWVFVAFAMGLYGIVNCLYTLTNEYIYPPIIYTDFFTYLYLLLAVTLAVGGFLLKSHLTCKYKRDIIDKLNSTVSERSDSEHHPYIGMKSGDFNL